MFLPKKTPSYCFPVDFVATENSYSVEHLWTIPSVS